MAVAPTGEPLLKMLKACLLDPPNLIADKPSGFAAAA
jgi:hypothetical protein